MPSLDRYVLALAQMSPWLGDVAANRKILVRDSQFKRRLPVIAKLSERTSDRDFRYARDWGR